MLAGIGLGVGSFVLGLNGWVIDRLWLYLLGSAMLILIGMQLIIYWVLLRVLDELSRRDALTSLDLNPAPQIAAGIPHPPNPSSRTSSATRG